MPACAICLELDPDDGVYHRACLERLFGIPRLPDLDLDLTHFPADVAAANDHMSVSGFQRKALLHRDDDRLILATAATGSTYILKPQTERLPHVPENEHVTMRIAHHLGLIVPPLGLIALRDGSWAYITRRFDRTDDIQPRKLQKFDFCALLGKRPEHKASGTAEECAAVVLKHVAEPPASLRQLFLLFLSSFWLGNGDLHLKNISLLADRAHRYALSPAYDIVGTAPYKFARQLLSISGRRDDLSRTHFVQFGTGACHLDRAEVDAMIDAVRAAEPRAQELIDRSFMPAGLRTLYKQSLVKRTRALRPTP